MFTSEAIKQRFAYSRATIARAAHLRAREVRGERGNADLIVFLAFVTFVIFFVPVVLGTIWWHGHIRQPVDIVTQRWTDVYANYGTNEPPRYVGMPGWTVPSDGKFASLQYGQDTVKGRMEVQLLSIPYVASVEAIQCGASESGFENFGGLNIPRIEEPPPGGALQQFSPVACAADVTLVAWPWARGWSALNTIMGGDYISTGTGFSDGGLNAGVN